MMINRKQILKGFLETVGGISDKEYQKRVWIRAEGPECDDFTETSCNFFQEGDGILEDYKNFGISESQYETLLRNKLKKFPKRFEMPEDFIDTPEWDDITKMAKGVLAAFDLPTKG